MTTLQLTSGKLLRLPETYERIRGLLEAALADGKLLELRRSDGAVVLINPHNVDYIENSTQDGATPAPGPDHTAHAT